MDKIQKLIDKQNKEVEMDFKNNPFMLKVGQFVSVNDTGVYKIIKFSKDKGQVTAVVNLIFSDAGLKQNRLKPVTVEINKMKPAILLINELKKRADDLNKLAVFLTQNMLDVEMCKRFDNCGNPVK